MQAAQTIMTPANQSSRLANVRRGRQGGARRFCFYGPESVGKTTLAAHAPNPIFIDIEDGTAELDVARYEFEGGALVPSKYSEILAALEDLRVNPHDFKTVVIDSLDRLEAMIWNHCIERDSGKGGKRFTSIEGYGYGKGYVVALDELRALFVLLEDLRKSRGMNIVFVGHSHVKPFKNPSGEDYDRYWLRVHSSFAGQTKEWVDVVGFCTFEEGGGKLDPDQARAKGWSTGRRLLKLERSAAYDAKSRIPLPSEIELTIDNPWDPLQKAMDVGQRLDAKALLALIADELTRLANEGTTKRVNAACKGVTDTTTLGRYLMELKGRNTDNGERNV